MRPRVYQNEKKNIRQKRTVSPMRPHAKKASGFPVAVKGNA